MTNIFDIEKKNGLVDDESVKIAQKASRLQSIRKIIEKDAGDMSAIVGTSSDAAMIAIDNLAMDVLAIDKSAHSSYKEGRIELYEELHGEASWPRAVAGALQWFEGRKAGVIKSTVDVKGGTSVLASIAQRSTAVANVLAAASADGQGG